jgi:cytidine deaminase
VARAIGRLVERARGVLGEFRPSKDCSAGGVAAALITAADSTFTGVCVDTSCSLGFCAEHAAVAEMLKARQSHIAMIVAVTEAGIVPPCGRCRELMWQVDPRNADTQVVVAPDRIDALKDLLPDPWRGVRSRTADC